MTNDLFEKQKTLGMFLKKCEFDHLDHFGQKIVHLGIKKLKEIKKKPLFMTQMNA